MRKPLLCLSLLACLLTTPFARAQGAAQSPPTPDQIQKMIDAKAWVPALRAIGQILPPANAGAAANADRYSLLMMRGECLVQLKDSQTAVIAFDQAAIAAASLPQNEAARAMSLLLRKCPTLSYTPRTGDNKTPLDLTDPNARKRAMAALLADELPAVAARVNQAVTARTLPPILSVGPTLRDLHALEQVGTGDDKQTLGLVQPLADRVYDLIDTDLNRVDTQVQSIRSAASRTVAYGGGSFGMVDGAVQFIPDQGSSGLTGDNRQALRDTISYLGTVGQTCEDLTAVARRYDRDGQRWQALAKRTQGIMDTAQAVYDHE